jgi:hypothetical protein
MKKKAPVELNKLAAFIVDQATNEEPQPEEKPTKNQAAVELGRLGGLKGGTARAKKLTAKRRTEIAKKAAKTRWNNTKVKQIPLEKKGPLKGQITDNLLI